MCTNLHTLNVKLDGFGAAQPIVTGGLRWSLARPPSNSCCELSRGLSGKELKVSGNFQLLNNIHYFICVIVCLDTTRIKSGKFNSFLWRK